MPGELFKVTLGATVEVSLLLLEAGNLSIGLANSSL